MAKDTTSYKLAAGAKARPNSGVIQQVHNFLAGILPSKLVRAIDILLHPCCDYTVTVGDITCASTNSYNFTLTLNKPINLHGSGYYTINIGAVGLQFDEANFGNSIGTWDDQTTTIPFTNAHSGSFFDLSGSKSITLQLFLPVHAGKITSVVEFSPGVLIIVKTDGDVIIPSCP